MPLLRCLRGVDDALGKVAKLTGYWMGSADEIGAYYN